MRHPIRFIALAGVMGVAPLACAQSRFILADRTNNALFAICDLNGNGAIDEPAEVSLLFGAGNAAGTLNVDIPTSLTVRSDGLIALGDQPNRAVYLMRDYNRDGDCMDVGESAIVADASNVSGVSFAFPTGVAFDPAGTLYVVNAGNASGNDGIYKLVDINGDGDFQDAGEVTTYVGAGSPFGPGNGSYGPQELVFAPGPPPYVAYFHNATANLHGVYRIVDSNGNGNCDDAGEFALFWGAGNAAGIAPVAGFALEPDAARPGSLYLLQTAANSTDQLIRIGDVNNDDDAMDAGESVIVWSTAEVGFINIDVVSLADGRVLITDNSGKRVIVLDDTDHNGLFDNVSERTTYFGNTSGLLGDIRQAAATATPCQANCDDSSVPPVLNANDFQCFLNAFAAGDLYANCDSSSVSPILNANDFQCFLNAFAAGCL